MMKRLLSLLLALAMLTACAAAFAEGDPVTAEPAAETTAAEATAAEPQAPVLLATVNGVEVTDQTMILQYFIAYYQYMYSMYGYDVSDPTLDALIHSGALDFAILNELTNQKAAELGLDTFTAEEEAALKQQAEADWEDYLTSVMESNGLNADATDDEKAAARATALAQIEAAGDTQESYVENVFNNLKQSEVQNRVFDHVTKDIKVTDEDVLAHFAALVAEDKERAETDPATYVQDYEFYTRYSAMYPGQLDPVYYTPEGFRAVNHILLKPTDELLQNWTNLAARLEEQTQAQETAAEATAETTPEAPAETAAPEATEEPVTAEMVDAAAAAIVESLQAKLDEISKKLADGAAFEDLIAEYGEDPGMMTEESRKNGYNVHAFSVIYDPIFREAAMSLEKVGDVSEPVLGSNGIHIIHYVRDIPAGAVEMTESDKQSIREELLTEAQNEAYSLAREEWRNAAAIEYTEKGKEWKDAGDALVAAAEEAEAAEAAAVEDAAVKEAVAP